MSFVRAVVAASVLSACGCGLLSPTVLTAVLPSYRPEKVAPAPVPEPEGPPDPARLFVVAAVIEVKVGDAYANKTVWMLGDEQGVDFDTQPVLEANGLRVCQFAAAPPERLREMLASERTCPGKPRRLTRRLDEAVHVPVGDVRPSLKATVRDDGDEARELSLASAQCRWELTVSERDDGRLTIRFVPQVKHGKARVERDVAEDPGGELRWDVRAREPVEELTSLKWELTVDPREYILIGGRIDKPDSVGAAFFFPDGVKEGATQRLLLLRATRAAAD